MVIGQFRNNQSSPSRSLRSGGALFPLGKKWGTTLLPHFHSI